MSASSPTARCSSTSTTAWSRPSGRSATQGIYKRDVRIGHNVWVGYGASFLRGVTVGDNCVVGTYAVVTKDVPANAVVAGVPARVLRMRPAPKRLRWG